MKPLFISYVGLIKGNSAQGWVVLVNHPELASPEDMTMLAGRLEAERGYDPKTLVFVNFQRLPI